MSRRLRALRPLMAASLRAVVVLQLAWLVVAPVQHLLSHDRQESAEPINCPSSETAAAEPECSTCLLLTANVCFQEGAERPVLDGGEGVPPAITTPQRPASVEPIRLARARAPPNA